MIRSHELRTVFFFLVGRRDDQKLLKRFRQDVQRIDEILHKFGSVTSMSRSEDGFAHFVIDSNLSDDRVKTELEQLGIVGEIKVGKKEYDEMEPA